MATTDDALSKNFRPTRPFSRLPRDGIFRFTVDQYSRLDEMGFFEDCRVELIRGVIFEMTINTGHATASRLASSALRSIFGRGCVVSDALPLDMGRRSLLEPDLTIAEGKIRDFAQVHPTSAALVVEISDATLQKDRTIKAHLYAQAGLAEYWILNLVDRQLEVHRNPGPDPARRGRFRYADVTTVPEAGSMAPLAAPGSPIAVADLLP